MLFFFYDLAHDLNINHFLKSFIVLITITVFNQEARYKTEKERNMQTIIRTYDKFWFLIGLGFIGLGFLSPQEFWFLVILIPLISGMILLRAMKEL